MKNLIIRLAARFLRSNLGKTAFEPYFGQMMNISLEGLNYGNDYLAEKAERYLIGKLASSAGEGAVILDVGANMGMYSKACLEAFSLPVIYAFEPQQSTFKLLKEKLEGEVRLVDKGVSDRASSGVLYAVEGNNTLSSLSPRKHPRHHWEKRETIETISLDEFAREENLASIYLIKLDIEGWELAALKGASGLLASGKVDHIQFEFGGAMLDTQCYFRDFWDLLSSDYRIYRILCDGLVPIDEYDEKLEIFKGTNFLASRRDLAL